MLFLGTSHVINAVYPMELWEDYGIVSYNMAGHGNKMPTTYWVFENALLETTPKLVVIDCLKISQDYYASYLFSQVHISMDAIPLSSTKIQAIKELVDQEETLLYAIEHPETEAREEISLLWDFSVYHARWEELNRTDFEIESSPEKGAEARVAVTQPRSVTEVSPSERVDVNVRGVEYLKKIIEECQEAGIEVLLTYLPFPASMTEQREAYTIADIAEEYGVNYVNFLEMDVVNYYTDMYDEDSHLNPSGAHKITAYLGEYISEHYDLPDRREDEAYAFWNEDFTEYREYMEGLLLSQTSLDRYLMLLSDDSYDALISIEDASLADDLIYRRLLLNIGVSYSEIKSGKTVFAVTCGGEDVTSYASVGDVEDVQLQQKMLSCTSETEAAIRIKVYNHATGQLIDERNFNRVDTAVQYVAQ